VADLGPVRDALEAIAAAFEEAARRRVRIIRRIAAVEPAEGEAAPLRALIEALLRREAADADDAAGLEDRVARVLAEARAAGVARERLRANAEVGALIAELDQTWTDALAQAHRLGAGLRRRTPADVAQAFADYVGELRALHELDPAEAGDVGGATARYAAATHRLQDTLDAHAA
jgi:hypothetical protein